jgi:beta-lactamase regulating signal transducer with metallopeptidase domain/ankyrin repeat protein
MTALESVFSWVLTTTWQASVLAVLVLAAQWLLGARLNPRWRYALWLLVLLRLVLPDVPESALSLFRYAPAAPLNLPETIFAPEISAPLMATAPALPHEIVVPQPNYTFLILALLWLSGALGLLLLTFLVNRRFARHVANAPQITDESFRQIFADTKVELGIRRHIRLVESTHVSSPAIMGLFTPTLLLPTGARDRFTPRELRFIFLHELAHLKRGDVFVQALIALLQIIHWFNPVLWYAFRRLRADREPATDALVLSRTGEADKEPYGLMLLKLLEHFNQRHALPTLVGILEDKDQFKRRFSLIAKFTRGAYGWSLLGVVLLTLLAAVCLTKAQVDLQKKSPADSADHVPDLAVCFGKSGKTYGFTLGNLAHSGSISDGTIIPSTGETLSVWRKDETATNATLVFIATKPTGPSKKAPDGSTSQPIAERREEHVVPLNQPFSFRIFDGVDVTTAPTLDQLDALRPNTTNLNTKLVSAAGVGNLAWVKSLIGQGADPNGRRKSNPDGTTDSALYRAVTRYQYDVVAYLLEHGAKVRPSTYLDSAGHEQSGKVDEMIEAEELDEHGDAKMVKLFWDHGVRSISDLSYAITQAASADDITKMLAAGSPVDPPQDTCAKPLALAACYGRLDLVTLLVQRGAKVDPGNDSADALYFAAFNGRDDIVSFLLQHGARPRYGAFSGATSAFNSWYGAGATVDLAHYEHLLRAMLDTGALRDLTDKEKGRILSQSVGHPSLVKMLLDAGLSPELPLIDLTNQSHGTVISHVRESVAQSPPDANLKASLELLEAADKGASKTGSDTTIEAKPEGHAVAQYFSKSSQITAGQKPLLNLGITLVEVSEKTYEAERAAMDQAVADGNLGYFAARKDVFVSREKPLSLAEGKCWYSEGAVLSYVQSAGDTKDKSSGKTVTTLTANSVFLGINADFKFNVLPTATISADSMWQVTEPETAPAPVPTSGATPAQAPPQRDLSPKFKVTQLTDTDWRIVPGRFHALWIGPTLGQVTRTSSFHDAALITLDGMAKNKVPSRLAVFLSAVPVSVSDPLPAVAALVSSAPNATTDSAAPDGKDIAALVNGKPVYWWLIRYGRVAPKSLDIRKAELQAAIDNELIVQEDDADKDDPNYVSDYLKQSLDFAINGFHGDQAAFVANLKANGLTLENFAELRRREAIIGYFQNTQIFGPARAYVQSHLPPPTASPADAAKQQQELIGQRNTLLQNQWTSDHRAQATIHILDPALVLDAAPNATPHVTPASANSSTTSLPPLRQAITLRRPDTVSSLLDHGAVADINDVWTAVMNCDPDLPGAANEREANWRTLQALAAHGAFACVPKPMRGGLLTFACLRVHDLDVVRLLLSHGFSPTDLDALGQKTVLQSVRNATEGKDNWPPDPAYAQALALLEQAPTASAAPTASPDKTIQKLQTLVFDHVDFEHQDILGVIQQLTHKSKDVDPEKEGVSFVVRLDTGSPPKPDPEIRREITLHLQNATLAEVLGNIVQQTKLTYAFEEYAIYLRPPSVDANTRVVRTFRVPVNFLSVTLPAPGDTTSADGKTQVVTNRLMLLGFKFSSGALANYCPGSSTLVVSNTPEQLDLIAEYLKRLSPADAADHASSPSTLNAPTPTAPRDFVRLEVKVLQVGEEEYQGRRADIDAAVKAGDLRPLVGLKSCNVLSEPAIAMKSGEHGVIEAVREFPFPTQFKRDSTGSLTPTEFDRRDIGVRFPFTAAVDGDKISVSGDLSLSTFRGWTQTGLNTFSPGIDTQDVYFYDELSSGVTRGIATAGTEIADTNGTPATPGFVSKPPKLVRLFLFLTAKAMTEQEVHAGWPRANSSVQVKAASGNGAEALSEKRNVLEKDLMQARQDDDARHVLVDQVKNLSDDEFVATLAGLGRSTPEIVDLDEKISRENTDIVNLLNDGFTADHPRIVSMKAEVAAREAQRHRLVEGLHRAMAIDLQMADSRVALLQREVDAAGATAGP